MSDVFLEKINLAGGFLLVRHDRQMSEILGQRART
jgi:hypothetical protein